MRVFCFILVCLTPYLSIAQIDSAYRALSLLPSDSFKVIKLNDLALASSLHASDKAIVYAEEALGLAERIGYPAGQANAYLLIASALLQTGHADDAFDNYTQSLKICNKYGFRSIKSDVFRGMGAYFQATGDHEMAKHYIVDAVEIAIEDADWLREAKCYLNLGGMAQDQERLAYHIHAMQLLEKLTAKNSNNMSAMTTLVIAYQNIANNYRSHLVDSALIYLAKAEKINKIVKNTYFDLGIQVTFGFIYYEMGNYDEAISTGNQALKLAKALTIENMLIIGVNRMVGRAYEKKTNYPLVIKHYADAYNIAKKLGNTNTLIELELDNSTVFSLMKQHDNAFVAAINAINLARLQENFAQMASGELLAGKIMATQKKDVDAIEHFSNCISLIIKNKLEEKYYVEVYNELADAYARQQQHTKATEMKKQYKTVRKAIQEEK